jgi:hypothetical protein
MDTATALPAEILADADGQKVSHLPAEVTMFSEAVAKSSVAE